MRPPLASKGLLSFHFDPEYNAKVHASARAGRNGARARVHYNAIHVMRRVRGGMARARASALQRHPWDARVLELIGFDYIEFIGKPLMECTNSRTDWF